MGRLAGRTSSEAWIFVNVVCFSVRTSRNGRPSPVTTHRVLAVTTAAPSWHHTNTRTRTVAVFLFYDTPNLCPARFGGIALGRTPIYVLSGPVLCERPDPVLCLSDGVHRPECRYSVPAWGHGPGAGGPRSAVRPGLCPLWHGHGAGCVWGVSGVTRRYWRTKRKFRRWWGCRGLLWTLPGQRWWEEMSQSGCCCSLLLTETDQSKNCLGSKEGSLREIQHRHLHDQRLPHEWSTSTGSAVSMLPVKQQ